jgi:hypothetical protein
VASHKEERIVDELAMRFEWWDDQMRLIGRKTWREANCSVCNEPIQWVLDMFSFRSDPPGYSLAHARCVWTKEGFRSQERLAMEAQ